MEQRPADAAHRTSDGFRNPWPDSAPPGPAAMLRWMMQRIRHRRAPDPLPGHFPVAASAFEERAGEGELTATWVGQATVLLQLGALNVLTDPIWSDRASPVSFAGPKRVTPPGIDFDALPPIDVVLLSHNHYDHLDRRTVRRLAQRMPGIEWIVPLELGATISRWGAKIVRELDWWSATEVNTAHGRIVVRATPAQHFSARSARDRNRSLWCGYVVESANGRVYFAGDTALHPEFGAIGERCGPFDLAILPIGAYEPRWFMRYVHLDPDDALAAYEAIRAAHASEDAPAMLAIHWGTFRLTDEPMDEPPRRTRALWESRGHASDALWIAQHGETRALRTRVTPRAPSRR